jgi:hypothetical protein
VTQSQLWWLNANGTMREIPVYSWESKWGQFTLDERPPNYDADPANYKIYLKPYASGNAQIMVALPRSPKAPVPYGIRPLSSRPVVDMMLRIIALRTPPPMPQPFNSGLYSIVKKKWRTARKIQREDVYDDELRSGDPFAFARVMRDLSERRRLRKPSGKGEQALIDGLYNDLTFEVQYSLGLRDEAKAKAIVDSALGFDIKRAPVGMRPPRVKKEDE